MVQFTLTTLVLICMTQVCSANPLASENENDPAKLFSADELQRAKNAGLSDRQLVSGKAFGFTLDEMIKLKSLTDDPTPTDPTIFGFTSKLCEILVPGHKTASNYTNAHVVTLKKVMKTMSLLPDEEELPFIRTSICNYVSQPDSHSFDPKFVPQVKLRYFKAKARNATGAVRVQLVKEMCCVDGGGDMLDPSSVCDLNLDEIKEFDKHWNNFVATNVPDSFKKVCDFLDAKNPADEECLVAIPNDEDKVK